MPCTMKHTCPSHPHSRAINSSPEVKPWWLKKVFLCLGFSLTLLTMFSTVSVCGVVDSVIAWWCSFLWPWLIRHFVMIVSVLWVLYLQWHHMPSSVSLLYLPHPCHLSLFLLTNGHHKKEARHMQVEEKEGLTLLSFSTCACYYPTKLTLMNTLTTKDCHRLPTSITIFMFISLLLVSSFFESRDKIPFKG
jgi:hypothetical protein